MEASRTQAAGLQLQGVRRSPNLVRAADAGESLSLNERNSPRCRRELRFGEKLPPRGTGIRPGERPDRDECPTQHARVAQWAFVSI
jgi:hypothetical protein